MSDIKIDTIAAVSTAQGRAAISVIRLSGPRAFEITGRVFKTGAKNDFPSHHTAYCGKITDPKTNLIADRVIVTAYVGPHSYTGEDLIEISTHGNMVVTAEVLRILLQNGARLAEAGEFTRRAFLNGKMDLLSVEAVSRLLSAETASQARLAINQLGGLPSKYVEKIRKKLLNELVQLEASLNFPEDAIESINEEALGQELKKIAEELSIFAQNAYNGGLVSGGLKIAILGRPNSGKSSLMNLILGRDRAIVTSIAGTTRDTLEESFVIGNYAVKLIDTAGLRKADNEIEKIGIERTNKAVEEAFALVGVFDTSEAETPEDEAVLKKIKDSKKPFLLVKNKSDLPKKLNDSFFKGERAIETSALKGRGLADFINELKTIIVKNGLDKYESMVLLGASQAQALNNALNALKRACGGIGVIYQDMLAVDLQETVRELGKISGETVEVNTLDLIFERFCIGK